MTNPVEASVPSSTHGDESSKTQVPFTRQEQLFLFCSLMLITCSFLPWRITDVEQGPWDLFSFSSVTRSEERRVGKECA